MNRKLLSLSTLFISGFAYSQIGVGSLIPDPSAQMDIVSSTKGVLIPRIFLESDSDSLSIKNGNVESLLIYNINEKHPLSPGYYYWMGVKWTRVLTDLDERVFKNTHNLRLIVENGQLLLEDSDKNKVLVPISDLNVPDQVTTFTNNGNGTYTYTNEVGSEVIIDVPAEVSSQFESIVNNPGVQQILNQYISKVSGNVSFDATGFTYTDEKGEVQTIDFAQLVKANQTETVLKNNGNGTYTYTNEVGTAVTIDIPASLTNNNNKEFNDYLTNFVRQKESITSLTDVITTDTDEYGQEVQLHTLIYVDERGVSNTLDLSVLVKGTETVTSLTYDPSKHIFSYTNEKGDQSTFNLEEIISDIQALTRLELDTDNKKLVYTDENKVDHTINLAPLIQEPWYSTETQTGATSNTEDIYTKGWVGIGFTQPSTLPNEKLRVNGSITTVNSYYADYVFEDYFEGFSKIKLDYKFKDLATVEDFIKINRHLPGITPIHQLSKVGEGYAFNMSELSIQLLEKTEELYLHLIDQKKVISRKRQQIIKLEELNKEILERLSKLECLLTR